MISARDRVVEIFPGRLCDCQELTDLAGHPVTCLLCRIASAIIAHAQVMRDGCAKMVDADFAGEVNDIEDDGQTRIGVAIRMIEVA